MLFDEALGKWILTSSIVWAQHVIRQVAYEERIRIRSLYKNVIMFISFESQIGEYKLLMVILNTRLCSTGIFVLKPPLVINVCMCSSSSE